MCVTIDQPGSQFIEYLFRKSKWRINKQVVVKHLIRYPQSRYPVNYLHIPLHLWSEWKKLIQLVLNESGWTEEISDRMRQASEQQTITVNSQINSAVSRYSLTEIKWAR